MFSPGLLPALGPVLGRMLSRLLQPNSSNRNRPKSHVPSKPPPRMPTSSAVPLLRALQQSRCQMHQKHPTAWTVRWPPSRLGLLQHQWAARRFPACP